MSGEIFQPLSNSRPVFFGKVLKGFFKALGGLFSRCKISGLQGLDKIPYIGGAWFGFVVLDARCECVAERVDLPLPCIGLPVRFFGEGIGNPGCTGFGFVSVDRAACELRFQLFERASLLGCHQVGKRRRLFGLTNQRRDFLQDALGLFGGGDLGRRCRRLFAFLPTDPGYEEADADRRK